MEGKKTFVRITNTDIYNKLLELEAHVKTTNGKVKLNKWISTTALTLTTSVVVGLILFVFGGI